MNESLLRRANQLALITIGYNILEGLCSVWLGANDETLALFGFGVDSFVEVISGIGIWHMLRRQARSSCRASRDRFERTALRTTGTAFYLLSVGLVISAAISLWQGHAPAATSWGIVISLVSIASMWLLIRAKVRVGTLLNSEAILADAACTRTCLRLSVVLLLASAGYELTGIAQFDAAGSLLIAWFSWGEGREAFGKAAGKACACSG